MRGTSYKLILDNSHSPAEGSHWGANDDKAQSQGAEDHGANFEEFPIARPLLDITREGLRLHSRGAREGTGVSAVVAQTHITHGSSGLKGEVEKGLRAKS